ncbi:MAG: DinB family protein [Anaerolineales bacterium]
MKAKDMQHLYEYHFTRNREIWDQCVTTLTLEQFKQKNVYSVGSVRNQCVHILNVDERWFAGLRGDNVPGWAYTSRFKEFDMVRKKWDQVEAYMREYLVTLSDENLDAEFDDGIKTWQVLYHVLNRGTDHRAQLLAALHGLGARSLAQDYFFFAAGIPIKAHPAKAKH